MKERERCSPSRETCRNTVVWAFFCIDSPRKEPFPEMLLKSSSGCWCFTFQPTVVSVVAFLRYNSWSGRFCLASSVCRCATLTPVVIATEDFQSQDGGLPWICWNKLFVLCSLPKCFNPPSPSPPPLVGHPRHLLALPSLNQKNRSRRASVWPAMSHIWRRFIILL